MKKSGVLVQSTQKTLLYTDSLKLSDIRQNDYLLLPNDLLSLIKALRLVDFYRAREIKTFLQIFRV